VINTEMYYQHLLRTIRTRRRTAWVWWKRCTHCCRQACERKGWVWTCCTSASSATELHNTSALRHNTAGALHDIHAWHWCRRWTLSTQEMDTVKNIL